MRESGRERDRSVLLAGLTRIACCAAVVGVLAACSEKGPPVPSGRNGTGGSAGSDAGGGWGVTEPVLVGCANQYLDGEARSRPDDALAEASGLVVGRRTGALFSHNDSGDSPRLFAFTEQGESLGTLPVLGAALTDWEDIAAGFGAEGEQLLYIGDIGDNEHTRARVRIVIVEEPKTIVDGETLQASSVTLTYPDEPHDAETLLADPDSDEVVLVTKSSPPRVYSVNLANAGDGDELELVARGELAKGVPDDFVPSAGDVSFGGDAVIVRDGSRAYLWERAPSASLWAAFESQPCEVPLAIEEQGEGIAFAPDGGYFTLSESQQPLYYFGVAK